MSCLPIKDGRPQRYTEYHPPDQCTTNHGVSSNRTRMPITQCHTDSARTKSSRDLLHFRSGYFELSRQSSSNCSQRGGASTFVGQIERLSAMKQRHCNRLLFISSQPPLQTETRDPNAGSKIPLCMDRSTIMVRYRQLYAPYSTTALISPL